MRQLLKGLYKQVRTAHWAVTNELVDVARDNELQAHLTALADDLYALKESWKLVDALRKELNKTIEALEQKICFQYVATTKTGEPIRTDFCTASPDAKQTVKLPLKNSPEWNMLMAYFGVPLDAPFSPDWNKMIARVTEDLAAGKPCPPGCDPSQMYTICKVTVRKRRPILDDKESVPEQDPQALKHVAAAVQALKNFEPTQDAEQELMAIKEILTSAANIEELNQPPEVETQKKLNEAVPTFMRKDEERNSVLVW